MARKRGVDPKWQRRNLCRFAIALSDLKVATETCGLMLGERPGLASPHYWAYHTAIVNSYARPFTENKPLGSLPESVRRSLSADERQLHDEVLEERRTATAHSDLKAKPVYFMARGATLFESGVHSEGGGFATTKTAWTFDRWERIESLTRSVGTYVQDEAFRLVEQIYGNVFLPGPLEIPID